jgi:hypothetical protein
MNIFTKVALTLSLALSLSSTSFIVSAAEPAAAATASASTVISHIEKGLVEIGKSDFSAAQVHLKAARASSELLVGTSEKAKKAHAILMQGQIASKAGNVSKATEELNKALEIYRTL